MKPIEFKEIWMKDNSEQWMHFPIEQIENSNLGYLTKQFLKVGFPKSAAPFLGFGPIVRHGKFNNIKDYFSEYELEEKTKNYWMFGSDGSGNLICIDSSSDDKLVLLDHEQGFELIENINKNISELASFILLFKNFIKKINTEFGKDGFFNSRFTKKHLTELEYNFKELNHNYHIESSFWNTEVENLRVEIE